MELYILRHGIAVEAGLGRITRDADRPLTPEGRSKLQGIVKAMEALELEFDLILSSPYARALETAEIVAKGLRAANRLELDKTLEPEGSFRDLIESLKARRGKSVLLVGHEPFLSRLISFLVSGRPNLSIRMKKGGLCKLTIETLKYGRCAALEWLLTPRQMVLMD
jgi:phosphohistidine phosphatase